MIQDEWRKRAKIFHLSYTEFCTHPKDPINGDYTVVLENIPTQTTELGLWEVCKRPMARR